MLKKGFKEIVYYELLSGEKNAKLLDSTNSKSIQIVLTPWLEKRDNEYFLNRSKNALLISGDKLLEKCIESAVLPLAEVKSYKVLVYKELIELAKHYGFSRKLTGFLENMILLSDSAHFEAFWFYEKAKEKVEEAVNELSENFDSDLQDEWASFSKILVEKHNLYDFLPTYITRDAKTIELYDLICKAEGLFVCKNSIPAKAVFGLSKLFYNTGKYKSFLLWLHANIDPDQGFALCQGVENFWLFVTTEFGLRQMLAKETENLGIELCYLIVMSLYLHPELVAKSIRTKLGISRVEDVVRSYTKIWKKLVASKIVTVC